MIGCAFGDVATPPSYCSGWVSAATAISDAPGGSSIYFVVNEPGPFLSSVTEDLYDIVRASGFDEAKRQLVCLAMWAQTATGTSVDAWMNKVGNAMLALVHPATPTGVRTAIRSKLPCTPGYIRGATGVCVPNVQTTGGEQALAPQGSFPWVYVGAVAAVLGVLGFVAYKKGLIRL